MCRPHGVSYGWTRAFRRISQVFEALQNAKKRQGAWTTTLELTLLCELWARIALRDQRKFAFAGFTEKATTLKYEQLKQILKPEYYELPLHTPPDELAKVLASCKKNPGDEGGPRTSG